MATLGLYTKNQKNQNDTLLKNLDEDQAGAEKMTTQELLQKNYLNSQNQIEQSRNDANQAAAITLERLKKYLPDQLKQSGLGGSGIAESTMIGAYNNYANQVGQNERNYQDAKTALDQNYNATQVVDNDDVTEVQDIIDSYISAGKYDKAQEVINENEGILSKAYRDFAQYTISESKKVPGEKDGEAFDVDAEGKPVENGAKGIFNRQMFNDGSFYDTDSKDNVTYYKAEGSPVAKKVPVETNTGWARDFNDNAGDNFGIEVTDSTGTTRYKVEKGYDVNDDLNTDLTDAFKKMNDRAPNQGDLIIHDGHLFIYAKNNEKEGNPIVWAVVQNRAHGSRDYFTEFAGKFGLGYYDRDTTAYSTKSTGSN